MTGTGLSVKLVKKSYSVTIFMELEDYIDIFNTDNHFIEQGGVVVKFCHKDGVFSHSAFPYNYTEERYTELIEKISKKKYYMMDIISPS